MAMAKKKDTRKKPTPTVPPKKAKGLTIRRVPDLTRKVLPEERFPTLPRGTDMVGQGPHPDLNVNIVHDGLTDEQRAVKDAGRLATTFMARPDIASAIDSMVTLRRGYAIVYRAYREIFDVIHAEATERGESVNPFVEDFLVQYAMYEASKEFSEHQFMNGMINTTMPFMAEVIDAHTKAEEAERLEDRVAADAERRVRPVPIGFYTTVGQTDPHLFKDVTLTLVGWDNALLWLADNVVTHVLDERDTAQTYYTLVRFMRKAPKDKERRQLIRVPASAWRGCADSQKKMAVCMGTYVADKLPAQPDLLIVDDLAHAYSKGFVGRPAAATAGDAERQLRKWCNLAGCGILAFVPLEDREPVDTTGPEWEQLRTFTNVRAVNVSDTGGTHYRVTVGNHAAVFDVDKSTLDSYGHGDILLPAGIETGA